jgi:hypothetical protein
MEHWWGEKSFRSPGYNVIEKKVWLELKKIPRGPEKY